MSELLKRAISAVSELSEGDQDEIARMMLAMSADEGVLPVEPGHKDAVAEGLAQARSGEIASDEAVEAAWRRFES